MYICMCRVREGETCTLPAYRALHNIHQAGSEPSFLIPGRVRLAVTCLRHSIHFCLICSVFGLSKADNIRILRRALSPKSDQTWSIFNKNSTFQSICRFWKGSSIAFWLSVETTDTLFSCCQTPTYRNLGPGGSHCAPQEVWMILWRLTHTHYR